MCSKLFLETGLKIPKKFKVQPFPEHLGIGQQALGNGHWAMGKYKQNGLGRTDRCGD
jgi:hypothetical protein